MCAFNKLGGKFGEHKYLKHLIFFHYALLWISCTQCLCAVVKKQPCCNFWVYSYVHPPFFPFLSWDYGTEVNWRLLICPYGYWLVLMGTDRTLWVQMGLYRYSWVHGVLGKLILDWILWVWIYKKQTLLVYQISSYSFLV